ncbi:MAG: hypothetical protein R2845_11400 [Thermomicrobiales bacterium]
MPDADLPALYSAAEVVAFPSWYEGFGTARARSDELRYPGRRFEPRVSTWWSAPASSSIRKMNRPWAQQSCAWSPIRFTGGELVERGQEQAARYSWRETARATLDLLTKQADIPG